MIDFHGLSDDHLHAATGYLETAERTDQGDPVAARELAQVHALLAIAAAVRALDLSFQYAHDLEAEEEDADVDEDEDQREDDQRAADD